MNIELSLYIYAYLEIIARYPQANGQAHYQMKNTSFIYCRIFNISRTKSLNLNDSRLVLQLLLPNPLQPGVKSRMRM